MIRCGFSSSEGSAELSSHDRESAFAALHASCSVIPKKRLLKRLSNMRSDLTTLHFASAIEHGIAVWSEGRSKPYRRKLYSILWAIRNERKLFARHDPWDLAWIKEDALISSGLSSKITRDHDSSSIALSTKLHGTITHIEADLKEQLKRFTLRRCPRCQSQDFERIAVQTRSADEGMTQMLQCTACNHRFK
jgi:DNA-directed RNA polymerase subunit M/transcription elongation factor TFIIS